MPVRILPAIERARARADRAGARNLLLLTYLRWLAVLGQLGAILTVHFAMGAALPVGPMIAVLAGLVALNLATITVLASGRPIASWELTATMLLDFCALTGQLYMSGGATNPFAPIGLLQVVLGAVLLETWASWLLAVLHSVAFGVLAVVHRPLILPPGYASSLSPAHILASWIDFVLAAVLLVFFVTRIGRNLRQRDASLADMRQRAAEEDHIVRMGLLASGAAHELGTPLSQVSVILGDWRHDPRLSADATMADDIAEMQVAVARCKEIVGGILYASGEARSEQMARTTLRTFLAGVTDLWSMQRAGVLTMVDRLDGDRDIAADRTLAQILTNVLDNAAEAGARHVEMIVEIADDDLILRVTDDGSGFPEDMLATIGKPYTSTKDRRGAGLGLFLTVNVLRKLGGTLDVRNGGLGGAVVTLTVPLSALTLETRHG